MSQHESSGGKIHEELSTEHHDPLIRSLHGVIRICVKFLAVLMVLVIILGVADVCYVLYARLSAPPIFLLSVGDIFKIFGAFMVVLIAIEIFINIRLYLGSNTLPIKLVIGTALMAIARKVIVLDLQNTTSIYVFAIAAVVLALGIAYWLVGRTSQTSVGVN
ncbi:MAG: phosphate-starvation-inducible PsiE family protein [Proteobacteria bacterium]|nr:phosphate-starvation-inducible PsiE family protein [Pseudomonadota bacterium]